MSEINLNNVCLLKTDAESIANARKLLDNYFSNKNSKEKDFCKEKALVTVNALSKIVADVSTAVKDPNVSQSFYEIIQILYRGMRNYIVHNRFSQDLFVTTDITFLSHTNEILAACQEHNDNCVLLITQFLCNLTVQNESNAIAIWDNCLKTLLDVFVKHDEPVAAVLYNILLFHTDHIYECKPIYSYLINAFAEDDGSRNKLFYLFELLRLFLHDEYFISCYTDFNLKQRVALLTLISCNSSSQDDNSFILTKIKIDKIIEHFITKCEDLFDVVEEGNKILEVAEIDLMLRVIADFATVENYKILEKEHLMEKCIQLLIRIHLLGKEGNNVYTPITKLVDKEQEENLKNEPLHNFKSQLVRTVGNLCYKDRTNQDKIREMECIPIIMECCVIDARNPFIQQWAISAMRYLCEGNLENQNVIRNMKQESKIDPRNILS